MYIDMYLYLYTYHFIWFCIGGRALLHDRCHKLCIFCAIIKIKIKMSQWWRSSCQSRDCFKRQICWNTWYSPYCDCCKHLIVWDIKYVKTCDIFQIVKGISILGNDPASPIACESRMIPIIHKKILKKEREWDNYHPPYAYIGLGWVNVCLTTLFLC